jgi:hypothetical protein
MEFYALEVMEEMMDLPLATRMGVVGWSQTIVGFGFGLGPCLYIF